MAEIFYPLAVRLRSLTPALLPAVLVLAAAPARAWWFGPRYTAYRPERPITIDGDPIDWPPDRRDDSADMTFAFAQDDANLYVMFVPHTRTAKAQLGGSYGQDLSVWVDPAAGMARRFGVRVSAPQKTGDGRFMRVLRTAGDEPAAARSMEVGVGDFDEHGAVEARVPLALLGAPRPKYVTVGLECSKPLKKPPKTFDAKGRGDGEYFAVLRIWVRVKLQR